jgi:hypothetical protein
MLHKLFKGLAPIAAMALAFGVSGCDGMNIQIGDVDGVPLSELDMSGDAPTELVQAGPDTIIVTEGDTLDIKVEGDDEAVAALRFSLDDGTLGIAREKDGWDNKGNATIRVTMPAPETIVLAGSGTLDAASLASKASITIAGSGKANITELSSEKLEVTVAGSGSLEAAGTVSNLELTIAGSGSAQMAGLTAETSDVTIAGSGNVEFASDGTVDANIVGSGNVTVTGEATCTVNSLGSGTVKCQTVKKDSEDEKETADAES